jgi:hypothetical protein
LGWRRAFDFSREGAKTRTKKDRRQFDFVAFFRAFAASREPFNAPTRSRGGEVPNRRTL